MKKVKGSYTVEAALIVPIVLLCILFIIHCGIDLYLETAKIAADQEEWKEHDPAALFREIELLEQVRE